MGSGGGGYIDARPSAGVARMRLRRHFSGKSLTLKLVALFVASVGSGVTNGGPNGPRVGRPQTQVAAAFRWLRKLEERRDRGQAGKIVHGLTAQSLITKDGEHFKLA